MHWIYFSGGVGIAMVPAPLVVQPLSGWDAVPHGLTWYRAYNSVKHNRALQFSEASLLNLTSGPRRMLPAARWGPGHTRSYGRPRAPRGRPSRVHISGSGIWHPCARRLVHSAGRVVGAHRRGET
jgi:hypothetical protein